MGGSAEGDGTRFVVETSQDRDLREAIFRLAVEQDWVLLELAEESASLEDIFVRLTTREEIVKGDPVREEVAS